MSTSELNLQAHRERLQEYVTAMKPGRPLSISEGVTHQRRLWNCLVLTLQQKNEDFISHYAEFLGVIHTHRKTVFHERYIFRFMDELPLTADELSAFKRMLNLMLRTCDPSSRHVALRQIDLRTTLSTLNNEQQRQNVMSFYEL